MALSRAMGNPEFMVAYPKIFAKCAAIRRGGKSSWLNFGWLFKERDEGAGWQRILDGEFDWRIEPEPEKRRSHREQREELELFEYFKRHVDSQATSWDLCRKFEKWMGELTPAQRKEYTA